jgi:hypothetical protein
MLRSNIVFCLLHQGASPVNIRLEQDTSPTNYHPGERFLQQDLKETGAPKGRAITAHRTRAKQAHLTDHTSDKK